MREWGHDVYLQRMLVNGNYSDKFEKVTTRHVGQSGVGNTLSLGIADEGLEVKFDSIYYFESNILPKQGDRIYEDYSTKNKNYTMFVVAAATPVRGRQGKILFWTVGANREK